MDSTEQKLQMTRVRSSAPGIPAPTGKGFGSTLNEHGARDQLGSSVTAEFLHAGVTRTMNARSPECDFLLKTSTPCNYNRSFPLPHLRKLS